MKKALLLKTTLALALATPLLASAESQLVTGTGVGTGTATARLDLRVVIPRVLYLGVGTGSGTPLASNASIDALTFDYSTNPLDVGTTAPAGSITSTGPTAATASIPVRVFGNNGQVTLAASTLGALTNATGDTIGEVTSGLFGPSAGKPVAMGYVNPEFAPIGTRVNAIVRGKAVPMEVASMPFVPNRYFRG